MKPTIQHRRDERSANQLGLPPNVVWLSEHSSAWADLFEREKALIMSATGPIVLDVQHVGSTSVAGMKAKPIIDMLLGVAELDTGAGLHRPLGPLGYRYLQHQIVPNHHVFAKGTSVTHLLHVVEHLGPQWKRLVAFRQILRMDPEAANRYQRAKVHFSVEHANNRQAYLAAKSPLIDRILEEVAARSPGASVDDSPGTIVPVREAHARRDA